MLEALETVDWNRLMGAHGLCEQLPDHLRALARPGSEGERASARADLGEMLLHQGTAYDVTPFAVPFLVEIAGAQLPDRAWVLRLLKGIISAEGNCSPEELGPFQSLGRDALADPPYVEDGEQWEPDDARYFRCVALAGKAVRWGVGTYVRVLQSDDASVVAAALDVIALCDPAPSVVDAVAAHLERLDDPVARANALHALARLEPAAVRPLLERAIRSSSAPERFVAAIMLAEMHPAPGGLAETLLEILATPGDVSAEQLPFIVDASASIANALLRLGADGAQRERALAALVPAFEAGAIRRFACARPIVELAFPEPLEDDADVAALTPTQRQVLRAIGPLAWTRRGEQLVHGGFGRLLDAKHARRVTLDLLGLTEWIRARFPHMLR